MTEHVQQPAAVERAHIDIHELFELNVWARRFNVTQEHLKEAVRTVGTCAQAVGSYLALPRAN
jgi:hypothetical protein